MKRISMTVLLAMVAATGVAGEHKPYTRNVAIVVYENAEPLDWTGPFEVYNDAGRFGSVNGEAAFNVYIVSKTQQPLDAQGLHVVPNHSIQNAPKPDIVLFPGGPSNKIYDDPAFFAWAKKAAEEAEIAQSVCTGAFVLGKAGLLDGLEVTTHFGSIDRLQAAYPKAMVKNGRRYVDNGHVVTTAGISAGIDGSLHVVARLLGRRVADQVAAYMEYHWSPEAFLASHYSYLNPSTDARGRLMQTGDMQFDGNDFTAAEATYRTILETDPKNGDAWYGLGYALRGKQEHAAAGQALARALDGKTDRQAAFGYYDAAAQFALGNKKEEALEMLRKAFVAGYPDHSAALRDPDLASLRSDPRVAEISSSR